MLRYRKSSLLRKQDVVCCLGSPAKDQGKLSLFWNGVHKYWLCFVAMHLIWTLVMVLLSCNATSCSHSIILFLGDGGELFWSAYCPISWGGQPSSMTVLCWTIQHPPAPGNQTTLGSVVQMWEAGGKVPAPKFCVSDTWNTPTLQEEAFFQ